MILHTLSRAMLAGILLLLAACGGGGGGVPTGLYELTVMNSDGSMAVAGARVDIFDAANLVAATATTDIDGLARLRLKAGVYSGRVQAQGYEASPPQGIVAPPFTVVAGSTLAATINLEGITNPAGVGRISGNADIAGALVVAEDRVLDLAVSGITDRNGNYVLFNVLPGDYVVTAFKAGYLSNEVAQTVAAADDLVVDLNVVAHASPSLGGQITFLATANGVVDITLLHPDTRDTIPGLSTENSGTGYSLANVPEGDYLAWASFANDGYVMDPDWVNKNGGYPAALEITMGNVAQTKDFSVTGAVQLTSPTNAATEVVPVVVTTTTPTFTWVDYSSAQKYVLEVLDLKGNTIWGGYVFDGITQKSTFNHPDIDTATPTQFNFDGSASALLVDGGIYQWRVHAFKWNTPRDSYVAISSSEQQMGLFRVALPPP